MRLTFLIIVILIYASIIHAQSKDTIYLWSDKVPGENEVKHAPIKMDNAKGNVIRLTDVTNPALIVFEPEVPNNTGVGIIICPGGGYSILAIDKEGYEVAEWLNKLGYVAFVLQYRVPNKQEGALNDIQRAIRIIRNKTDKYNLNPNRIGVMGFSAGGSLCARSSTGFNKNTYKNRDQFDTFSCRPNFSMLIYPAYLDKGENRSITPELEINNRTPPFFIFGTADDKYGNSSLVMTTALRDKHIPVELHFLNKGGHGYGLRTGNIAAETWPHLAENWLKRMISTNEFEKYTETNVISKSNDYVNAIPNKENLWIFIMAGQSNMAGRGIVEPQDTIPLSRILTINRNDEIIKAKEPLHFYEPSMAGLDCGLSFGKTIIEKLPDNISVLLIPTAVGGSSISQWLGDSSHRKVQLLTNFTKKVELAKKYGQVKGILWHQGESDANQVDYPFYKDRLSKLFFEFRKIVGNEKLPILIGELGSYSKNKDYWMKINEQIGFYALTDSNSVIVKTFDLNDKGDKIHFDSESQRILGKRFANEYIKNKK